MRDAGTKTIRNTSYWIVGGSFFIALLNLFLTRASRVPTAPSLRPAQTDRTELPLRVPHDEPNPALRTD